MPLQATSGAASYDAFGGGVAAVPQYIEDVFSTQVYTGTGATNNIVNGVDLATYGGLVWTKARTTTSAFTFAHALIDTLRGAGVQICSDRTDANYTQLNSLTSFNSDGYTLGADTGGQGRVNASIYGTNTYASWTFRKQPKFFDVVTYTGNGTNNPVPHNLGSAPGCVIAKATGVSGDWGVWHRGTGAANASILGISLNTTNGAASTTGSQSYATSTTFDVSAVYDYTGGTPLNVLGRQYVAYLFAHNAGGFGLTGTDNVISCGSYGSNTTDVNLGYEPQWIMIKNTTSGIAYAGWAVFDNMRGLSMVSTSNPALLANSSTAEYGTYNGAEDYLTPTATGFKLGAGTTLVGGAGSSGTWIYIAIRRGPMKVPTSGTSVFSPYTATLSAGTTVNAGLTPDLLFAKYRAGTDNPRWVDRLRGFANATGGTNPELYSNETSAESTSTAWSYNWNNTGYVIGNALNGLNSVIYAIKRAPSFFDEVCYTGTEISGQTFNHNLGVIPEMMIVKARDGTTDWTVYHSALGASARIYLNATNAANTGTAAPWNSTTPTSTVFSLGNAGATNLSGTKFVNYLFATCAGVSKVGSYTGTGTTKQVDCGFTGGARFVLIKKTSGTGSWYVWDSARGIVSGNDPYLLLNSTAAEVTSTDYIDTYSAGFEISSTAPSEINENGGSFIFLAIA